MTAPSDSAAIEALVAEGVSLYRCGLYFEAHERFEEAWVASGPNRSLELHALAQLAAGMHKREAQASPVAARAILGRARAKLERLPSSAFGLALSTLLADLDPVRLATSAAVPRLEPEETR